MSLQPNGAIIRASSVNACDAAESCLPAGNVSAALPHEEFFLEQVAGEGMSADGIIPLFSRGVSVLLFSRGKAEVRINGKSYSADAGTVATVMADEIVELEHVSEDCVCAMVSAPSETVIDFPSPADSDILTMTMISPVFTVPDRKMALVMEYYRLMQTVNADRDNVFRWEIMKSIFYSMMLEICDAYRQYGTVVGKSELLRHEQLGDELFRPVAPLQNAPERVLLCGKTQHYPQIPLSRDKEDYRPYCPGMGQQAHDNGNEEATQCPWPYHHADFGGHGILQSLRLRPVLQAPHRHHPSQVPQVRQVIQSCTAVFHWGYFKAELPLIDGLP